MTSINGLCLVQTWLDAKSLIGTFVGALLAFLANYYMQQRQRNRANHAAGNLALTILAKQYGDFVIFRAGLKDELEKKKDLPTWLQISPTVFELSESLHFEPGSLSFLLEHGRHDLLSKLLIAETKYHDLRRLLTRNTEACESREQKLAESGFGEFDLSQMPAAEKVIDRALRTKLGDFNKFLRRRAADDVAVYRDAGKSLHDVMTKLYRPAQVMPFTAMGAKDGLELQDWLREPNVSAA